MEKTLSSEYSPILHKESVLQRQRVAVSLGNFSRHLHSTGHTYPEKGKNAAQHRFANIETFSLFFADSSAWVLGGTLNFASDDVLWC